MQVYSLDFSAVLTNVTNVRFTEDGQYRMKIECTNCGRDPITRYVSFSQRFTSRGEVSGKSMNFVEQCHKCSGWQEIAIIADTKGCYRCSDEGYFRTLAEYKFLGCKPLEFCPGPIFSVTSIFSGTIYRNVSLSSAYPGHIHTWVGNDDTVDKGLYIANVKTRFVRSRNEKQ